MVKPFLYKRLQHPFFWSFLHPQLEGLILFCHIDKSMELLNAMEDVEKEGIKSVPHLISEEQGIVGIFWQMKAPAFAELLYDKALANTGPHLFFLKRYAIHLANLLSSFVAMKFNVG